MFENMQVGQEGQQLLQQPPRPHRGLQVLLLPLTPLEPQVRTCGVLHTIVVSCPRGNHNELAGVSL